MSISQAEVIVDRRQLKRRLLRWRILAVLAVLFALGALFWTGEDFRKSFDHVARIHIDGLITGDEATLKLLDGLVPCPQDFGDLALFGDWGEQNRQFLECSLCELEASRALPSQRVGNVSMTEKMEKPIH